MISLPDTGAIFSADHLRRFWLGRDLREGDAALSIAAISGARRLTLIGVQPSTADERKDDPTIRRELGFARRWGFAWIDKVNLFDLRSSNPLTLYTGFHPVTEENDAYVIAAAARADQIVCCWGKHGAHLARGARMRRLLLERGLRLWVLGFNADGSPVHPLARGKSRVPDDRQLTEWR